MKEKNVEAKDYEAPQVEVIVVEVEKGFSSSVGAGDVNVGGWGNGGDLNGEADEY